LNLDIEHLQEDHGEGQPVPRISCVIVNWNCWQDTIACLASLEKSDYPNLSIILIDNASTNNSVPQIRSSFPHLEIIESPRNLGFGRGNNLGIELALSRGVKYIWLLNNDTVVEPGTLAALVKVAEADPQIGEVGSVLHYMHDPAQIQCWGGGSIDLWTGRIRHFQQPVPPASLDYLTAASVLLRATALAQAGLFDPAFFMYWEDTDLSFRIRAAGWKLAVATDARLVHKENASTQPKSPRFDRYVSVSGRIFLRKFAPAPLISIFIFIFGRALNRMLRGEWKRAWAVLSSLVVTGPR